MANYLSMANDEIPKTTDGDAVSLVDEARSIRDEILKAKTELKAENDRKEKLQANELLSSSAGGRVDVAPKEETVKEYTARIMRGG